MYIGVYKRHQKKMEHNINNLDKNNRIRTYHPQFKFSTKSNNEQFSISKIGKLIYLIPYKTRYNLCG